MTSSPNSCKCNFSFLSGPPKYQNPNTKIQNPKSKIQNPKSKIQSIGFSPISPFPYAIRLKSHSRTDFRPCLPDSRPTMTNHVESCPIKTNNVQSTSLDDCFSICAGRVGRVAYAKQPSLISPSVHISNHRTTRVVCSHQSESESESESQLPPP